MTELSQRFAELMGRIARSDAELFRTLGEQNAAVRQMVDQVLPETGIEPASAPSALAASPLLPPEDCSSSRLKAQFRTLPPARAFLEEKLGPPPSGLGRITWAVVEQTVLTGAWPAGTTKAAAAGRGSSGGGAALVALEQRLEQRLGGLDQRLERIEVLLLAVLETSGPRSEPGNRTPRSC